MVGAAGTWAAPFVPSYPGQPAFNGRQLRSAHHRSPEPFGGQTVLVVGGGNSGAQIFAEFTEVSNAIWVTPEPPTLLPDEIDGRVLFDWATERLRAIREGRPPSVPVGGLGDIVVVSPVLAVREQGLFRSVRPFKRFTETGVVRSDGTAT